MPYKVIDYGGNDCYKLQQELNAAEADGYRLLNIQQGHPGVYDSGTYSVSGWISTHYIMYKDLPVPDPVDQIMAVIAAMTSEQQRTLAERLPDPVVDPVLEAADRGARLYGPAKTSVRVPPSRVRINAYHNGQVRHD